MKSRFYFVLILPLLTIAIPSFSQWHEKEAPKPIKKVFPLLYQTFNAPIAQRAGQPGYPSRIEGQAHVPLDFNGKFGQALVLPNTHSWIEYPGERNFPPTIDCQDGTITLWLSFDAGKLPQDSTATIILAQGKNALDGEFSLELLSSPTPRFRFAITPPADINDHSPGCFEVISPEIEWDPQAWHLMSVTWSDLDSKREIGEIRFYLDEKIVTHLKKVHCRFDWSGKVQPIRIGQGFIGRIDDLAIFPSALANPEIQKIYNHPEGVGGLYLPGY